jgi:hypothetical protein
MAFTTTIQPITKPAAEKTTGNNITAPLLGLLMLSVYAAHKSRKGLRKMKRRLLWEAFKMKLRSRSSGSISDRTLIYILIGVALLALLIAAPILALVLVLVVLILYLAGVIKF